MATGGSPGTVSGYNLIMSAFTEDNRRRGAAAIEECDRFFMKEGNVHRTLSAITAQLKELKIPYAVAGGMALVAHGFERVTVDVDILVDSAGLRRLHETLEGLGYIPPFAGSKNLKDTATGVRIEFLVAGQFPGDGKPKPVAFPDPAQASVEIDGVRYLGLSHLVELKLASGMTNPGRQKDLGDVQELIRILKLPKDFSTQLNPYVRPKFDELWQGLVDSPQMDY
jgi:hypothetical protein